MTKVPTTCCHSSGNDSCVCAVQAKCSCGKEHALHCSCEKAAAENDTSGARCSCRSRPAGKCNCERAPAENRPVLGEACPCGKRASDSCSCEKSVDPKLFPGEVDFTAKA